MSKPDIAAMDAIEIADFLKSQQTGVLSLADNDEGYAIPVSFAYHDDEAGGPSIYLRLGYAPGSEKRGFVEAADYVSFVVYDDTDEGWKSVIARGPIEQLSESSIDTSILEAVNDLNIPFFRVFDRPTSEIEFNIVRIDITDLDGVKQTTSGR